MARLDGSQSGCVVFDSERAATSVSFMSNSLCSEWVHDKDRAWRRAWESAWKRTGGR